MNYFFLEIKIYKHLGMANNMSNIQELMINRKESYIFFQINCIPLHPSIASQSKNIKSLDYELMNKSLDDALDWTYQDLKEHPELIPRREFLSPIQTEKGKGTIDIEVIQTWLKKGHHSYYQQEEGEMYLGKDTKGFPFSGLTLVDSGIYLGMNPIIITYDSGLICQNDIDYYEVKQLLPSLKLDEFGIRKEDNYYIFPAVWYTKDASKIIKLFGKNFAINYNNQIIQKRYK